MLTRQRQLATDRLHEGGIRLEGDLRRAGSHVVDVPREREPRAAYVGHRERPGRQRVDHQGQVLDVLEDQQPRVVELHVRLRRAVEDDGDAAAVVAHQLELLPALPRSGGGLAPPSAATTQP